MIQIPAYTPGPRYDIPDVTKYKYSTDHKWRIGTAKRRPLNDKEKFSYYNHIYKEQEDFGAMKKKWNRVVGGAIDLEPRVKYDFREKTPGPGRYTPSLKLTRPKSANYFIAEKTKQNVLMLKTGTNKEVGPGKYRPETAKYTSVHRNYPHFSVGKGKRPPLYMPKPWYKCESELDYWKYSSMGKQVPSKKRTEEMVRIGKSTRDREGLRGTFKCMMDRQPTQIRIPMPKF